MHLFPNRSSTTNGSFMIRLFAVSKFVRFKGDQSPGAIHKRTVQITIQLMSLPIGDMRRDNGLGFLRLIFHEARIGKVEFSIHHLLLLIIMHGIVVPLISVNSSMSRAVTNLELRTFCSPLGIPCGQNSVSVFLLPSIWVILEHRIDLQASLTMAISRKCQRVGLDGVVMFHLLNQILLLAFGF